MKNHHYGIISLHQLPHQQLFQLALPPKHAGKLIKSFSFDIFLVVNFISVNNTLNLYFLIYLL